MVSIKTVTKPDQIKELQINYNYNNHNGKCIKVVTKKVFLNAH